MKKVVFSFIFSLLLVSGFSQVKFGAKLGLSYSHFLDIVSSASFETNAAFSENYGLVIELSLSEKFALQTELYINSKKAGINQFFQGIDNKMTIELGFVSIPIMTKMKLGNFGILAGIEPSQRFFQRVISEENSTIVSASFGNSFDLGITGGIDYRIKKFSLGLRYVRGLRNIFDIVFTDANGQNINDPENNYARAYQFSVGYFFKN